MSEKFRLIIQKQDIFTRVNNIIQKKINTIFDENKFNIPVYAT